MPTRIRLEFEFQGSVGKDAGPGTVPAEPKYGGRPDEVLFVQGVLRTNTRHCLVNA